MNGVSGLAVLIALRASDWRELDFHGYLELLQLVAKLHKTLSLSS